MQTCDPILDMAISQADLRTMYERHPSRNPHLSKVNSGLGAIPAIFSATLSIKEKNVGFLAVEQAPKRSKYRNVRVQYQGMKFDSKHELKCWQNLKLREKAGEITHLERQSSFDLNAMGGEKVGKFTPDFTWYENGQTVVADAKSKITRKETAYRMRKRHFEAQYTPLVIREL